MRIKLFYARDFRALMLKYGRFALGEELSGTRTGHPRTDHEFLLAGRAGELGDAGAAGPPPDAVPIGRGPGPEPRRALSWRIGGAVTGRRRPSPDTGPSRPE